MIDPDLEFDDLLTPAEVARAPRVDPKTVTRWAREGKLPCIKTPGGIRRYRRADIDAQIAASEYPPRPS